MIKRILKEKITSALFHGKIIVVYGARQVGKTTLVKDIVSEYGDEAGYYNCDVLSVQSALSVPEPERLKQYFGDKKLIVLDEAQVIANIGKILKIFADELPGIQVIATGSSSFEMANRINEPLTGRAVRFTLFPLSMLEIAHHHGRLGLDAAIDRILSLGAYPEVYTSSGQASIERLDEIASNYLFKDILMLENIKKSEVLKNLLISLALQMGSQVSYNELASKLGINKLTVQKYIDLLEQSFIVFRLYSFSRNLRNELSKSLKIYFYDPGIRNALIRNFNPPDVREDSGMLWENFCVAERMKFIHYSGSLVNSYFWRTYEQKEIDYVEESGGTITGYEFKYSPKAKRASNKTFEDAYKAEIKVINRENYQGFLM